MTVNEFRAWSQISGIWLVVSGLCSTATNQNASLWGVWNLRHLIGCFRELFYIYQSKFFYLRLIWSVVYRQCFYIYQIKMLLSETSQSSGIWLVVSGHCFTLTNQNVSIWYWSTILGSDIMYSFSIKI